MGKKGKLIKGPDGKYYTPTAYKNQFKKILPGVDPYDVETPEVRRIDSNPKPGKTQISPLANLRGSGAGVGGMFGVKNR